MKKYFPLALLLGCLAAFGLGVYELFKLRFEGGDVYPKYSSLRADPLGTMALYESLQKVPGFSVQRDYTTANRMPDGKSTTYLHFAASQYEWSYLPENLFKELELYLSRGGRLVITLYPTSSTFNPFADLDPDQIDPDPVKKKKDEKPTPEKKSDEKQPDAKKPDPSKLEPEKPDDKSPDKKSVDAKSPEEKKLEPKPKGKRARKPWERDLTEVDVRERWGIGFKVIPLIQGDEGMFESTTVSNRTDLPLPHTLDWHSGVVCTNLDKAWRVIYSRGTNAVVIERKFGPGTVAIATDSFFVSNEALERARHADLLAWLIGSGKIVYFDEAHLGVTESSGVAVLMRKYHLQSLAFGLLLLAGLFIWKNSVSLVPSHEDEAKRNEIAGKTAAAGFVNLLRRNISTRDLLSTCFAEWRKSAAQTGQYTAARLRQAEAAYEAEKSSPSRDRHPLQTYAAICAILDRKHREPEIQKPEEEKKI